MQITWIIAEDDEDELTMYEVFMFNTVDNEELHVVENQLLSIFYIMKLSHELKFSHTYIFSHFLIRDGN